MAYREKKEEESKSQLIKYNYDNNTVTVGDNKPIESFFSSTVLDGKRGELKFKHFLDDNKVPFLYISQGLSCITDYSKSLNIENESKRPDFLINPMRDVGSFLVDVKTLTPRITEHTKKRYFTINLSELKQFDNLMKSTHMPVWYAISNRKSVAKKSPFHLISIADVIEIKNEFFKLSELKETQYEFIPIAKNRYPLYQIGIVMNFFRF